MRAYSGMNDERRLSYNVYRVAPNSISRLQFLKYGFHMSLCHIKDILGVVLRSVSITIVQSIIQFKFRTCMMSFPRKS